MLMHVYDFIIKYIDLSARSQVASLQVSKFPCWWNVFRFCLFLHLDVDLVTCSNVSKNVAQIFGSPRFFFWLAAAVCISSRTSFFLFFSVQDQKAWRELFNNLCAVHGISRECTLTINKVYIWGMMRQNLCKSTEKKNLKNVSLALLFLRKLCIFICNKSLFVVLCAIRVHLQPKFKKNSFCVKWIPFEGKYVQ